MKKKEYNIAQNKKAFHNFEILEKLEEVSACLCHAILQETLRIRE